MGKISLKAINNQCDTIMTVLVRVQIPVVIFDSQNNMRRQSNDIFSSVVLRRLASAQLDVKHFDFTDNALEITSQFMRPGRNW